jgi:hypothetical protein
VGVDAVQGLRREVVHCTLSLFNTATKIPIIYSQKSNCAASVLIITFMCLVSDVYIPKIGPHIFLQQNRGQTDHGN